MLSLCTLQLLSIQSPVGPALQSLIHFLTTSIVAGPRTRSRPLSMPSSCVAPSSTWRADSTVMRRLHQCSTPDRRMDSPNKKTIKWNISVNGLHTTSSASEVMNSSQSEACRCCTGTARIGVRPVFGLHGFGALVPFATDRHLATLRAVIHGESDDTVTSSTNSGTTDKFYREDSASAAQ